MSVFSSKGSPDIIENQTWFYSCTIIREQGIKILIQDKYTANREETQLHTYY